MENILAIRFSTRGLYFADRIDVISIDLRLVNLRDSIRSYGLDIVQNRLLSFTMFRWDRASRPQSWKIS